jgi:ABC-type Mn2+/Zn2+ transport system ATPase subunit
MVFMDEPFANLDASLTPDITGLMNKLKEDFEISVMIVTHDLKLAHQNSNVILKMTVKNGIPVSKYVW